MVNKRLFSISLAMILCLTLVSLAAAAEEYEWEVALDPGEFGFSPIDWDAGTGTGGSFSATEVFKDNLYVVVNSLGQDFGLNGGQIYRTPDGVAWEAVTPPGFGYSNIGGWDMKVFQDQLYVNLFSFIFEPGVILRSPDGVNWEAVSNSWEESPIQNPDKIGVFKGMVYVTAFQHPIFIGNAPAELWRSPNGDPDTWEKVREFGVYTWHTNGLDEYKGMLYMSVQDSEGPITIWRSQDGLDWQMVVSDGFASILGVEKNLNNGGDFMIHEDWLYFSVGPDIFRTKNGTEWELVMVGGFNNSDNHMIYALASHLGDMYAFTNNLNGCEAWMSPNGDAGTWIRISENAFGSSESWLNQYAYEATSFKGELYIGTDSDAWFGFLWKLVHP